MLEDLLVAVPGGPESVDLWVARLEDLGVVGWAIDGARLGHEGWLLARIAADEDGALVTDDDGDLQLLELDDLADALAETWPEVQVGEVLIGGQEVLVPLCRADGGRLHEVAFANAKGMRLDLEASMEKLTLAEVRIGSKTLFSRVRPVDGDEYQLVDVFSTAKGGSIVLWRRDPHLVLQVLRGSSEVELHVWEPAWTPVGAAEHDALRDELRPAQGDAAQIAEVLDLPPESIVALSALLARQSPPLRDVCDLLGLPTEALMVISGECAVEDLPGAVVHEPKTMMAALRAVMTPSDDDPAWVRGYYEGGRELRPWYVVSNLLWAAFGLVLVGLWRRGGARVWGVLGLVTAVSTAVELPVRWWLKRRRNVAQHPVSKGWSRLG